MILFTTKWKGPREAGLILLGPFEFIIQLCITQTQWLPGLHHDEVIRWKHFPRNRPFERGIHRSRVNSPHKGQWPGALMFSLICAWITAWRLSKQSWGWWFETLSSPLWRYSNVIIEYTWSCCFTRCGCLGVELKSYQIDSVSCVFLSTMFLLYIHEVSFQSPCFVLYNVVSP